MPARRREPLAREEPAELQVAATNGSIVTDSRGRKYIDFLMGGCVGNFGWRPAAIAKAVDSAGPGGYSPASTSTSSPTCCASRKRSAADWRRSVR
jgi:acetylornithine/succinyldiaminopimelate/putrescine aminotransferase